MRYLADLEERLSSLGAHDRLRVMLSNGGVATAQDAADATDPDARVRPRRRRARRGALRGAERLQRT